MSIKNLKVGQKLYYVPNNRYENKVEVTVEKVGRVWATLSNCRRIDERLVADGGEYTSPGHCYLSESDYLKEKETRSLNSKLRARFMGGPVNLTIDQVQRIFAIIDDEK